MTSSLWLPLFSSRAGEILSSFFLPIFPLPQPAGVCRNQKEGTCLTQSCLKLNIFTSFQDHLSFIQPKNGTCPAHQATESLGLDALSEIDIHRLSSRTIPYFISEHIFYNITSCLSLQVCPCPKLLKKILNRVTANEPNCLP